jgi:hypothetical protein
MRAIGFGETRHPSRAVDSAMIDTTIDDACSGLQSAVNQFIKKYQKRFRGTDNEKTLLKEHISKLVDHAQHILQTLTAKRNSLQHAVSALHQCWRNVYQTLKNSHGSNLQPCLQHVLQCYLRLGDGVVLLASGECRHPGDVKSIKFKSKLTKNQVRNDGYTMLYSKDLTYSGFGWDEFFDDQFGVHARLVNALKRISGGGAKFNVWETLLENGAQLFDVCLDTHETEIQLIRKSLENFRETVTRDLQILLPNNKVFFGTQDKMEYVEIRGSFKLQRRANEFQVRGDEGVLPNGWTVCTWERQIAIPTRVLKQSSQTAATKRRRIIDDSDDDDDQGRLYVRETKEKKTAPSSISSLNAIKNDCGVNAAELETAREILEAKQNEHDNAGVHAPDDGDVKARRACVRRLRKALQDVIERQEDPLQVWDAREHLRKETMQLGNDLLVHPKADHVLEAKLCFYEAMDLVRAQEVAHKQMVNDTNDDTEGAWLIQRNLLLLKGRAYTNCGIALLELSLFAKVPDATRIKHRVEASKALLDAQQCAQRLQTRAVVDRKRGASASETAYDSIEAVQLEALVLRSYGSVMWHNGMEVDAVKAFEDATATHKKLDKSILVYVEKGGDFLEQFLATLLECYCASMTLFDLAATKIERLQSSGPISDTLITKQRAADLVAKVHNAAEQGKTIVTIVANMIKTHVGLEYYFDDNGLLQVDQIDEALNDLKRRLDERFNGNMISNPPLALALSRYQQSDLSRNDLGSGILYPPRKGALTTTRFVVHDTARARRRCSKQGTGSKSDFDYRPALHEEESNRESSIPCMKWGDDLLPDVTARAAGEISLGLLYPACAPPLPSGFPLL